jgi:hypothetical protein
MKRETLFLKVVVFLMGILVLALCIFLVPSLAAWAAKEISEFSYLQYLILGGFYATAIPFFFALYQTLKLLNYIDRDIAFSELSVKALKNIKYCAIVISCLYLAGMPCLIFLAEKDDAPGVAALGLIISFASIVIAVFAAVLQKLLKNAIEIKSENDLTV